MEKQDYKFDVVGSFLRPDGLKKARAQFNQGKMTLKALTAVENEEIKRLIDKQVAAGLSFVTDGEFRRALWHTDFFWGFDGVEKVFLDEGYQFIDLETRSDSARLNDKIKEVDHPFLKHYQFVKEYVGNRAIPKQTIPAPAQFVVELLRPENQAATFKHYPNLNDLYEDIIKAYQSFIKNFYALGGRYLQLDDCTWTAFLNNDGFSILGISGDKVDEILERNLQINNAAIMDVPNDLVISTHVCRGNYHSHHAFTGGYHNVAKLLFNGSKAKRLYLEYDDERSGDFEPLKEVSKDKYVVLGLVTTKSGILENKEDVKRRILEASKYVPLERLSLSPQCGFASTEEGNILTEEQQWNKIKLIKEISEEIWGK